MPKIMNYIDSDTTNARCRLKLLHSKLHSALKHIKRNTEPPSDEIHYYQVTAKGFVLSAQDVEDVAEFMDMFLYD